MGVGGDSEQEQGCMGDARAVFHRYLFRVDHGVDAFPSCRRFLGATRMTGVRLPAPDLAGSSSSFVVKNVISLHFKTKMTTGWTVLRVIWGGEESV
jgi:hypothetical protein